MILYSSGAIEHSISTKKHRWLLAAACAILAFAMAIEISIGFVVNVGSILIFALLYFYRAKHDRLKAVIAAIIGGLLGWKLCDVFPLFFDLGILCAVPCILFAVLYCKNLGCRLLIVLLAPLLSRLMVSLNDLVLFNYTIISIGGDWSNDAQAIGCFSVIILDSVKQTLFSFRHRRSAAAANQ